MENKNYRISIFSIYLLLSLIFCSNLFSNNDRQKLTILLEEARNNLNFRPKASYLKSDSAYKLALSLKAYNAQADALLIKGSAMLEIGKYREAIDTLNISLKLYESFIEKTAIAINLSMLGRANTQIGKYSKAKKYLIDAVNLYSEIDTATLYKKTIYKEYAKVFNYLGLLHKRMNINLVALNYHFKELEIYQKANDQLMIGACYGDIGRMYRYMNKMDSALYYTYMGYEIVRQYDNSIYLAHIEKKMGLVCTEMVNYLEAMKYFKSALVNYRANDDLQGVTVCLNHIGRIYSKNNNNYLAHKYYDSALAIAKQTLDIDNLQYIYKFKAEAYKESGEYNLSLDAYLQYFAIKDSINTVEINSFIQEMEAKYRSHENIDKIIQMNKERFRLILYFGIFITILFSFILWSIFRNRKLKKELSNNIDIKPDSSNIDSGFISTRVLLNDTLPKELSHQINTIHGYISLLYIETKANGNNSMFSYCQQIYNQVDMLINTLNQKCADKNPSTTSNKLSIKEICVNDVLANALKQYDSNTTQYVDLEISDFVFINSDFSIVSNLISQIISYFEIVHNGDRLNITNLSEPTTQSNSIALKFAMQSIEDKTANTVHQYNEIALSTAIILANVIDSKVESKTISGEIIEITVYLHSYDIDNQI